MRYAQLSVSKSATPTACRQTNRSHKPTEDTLGATFEVASVAGLSFVSSSDDDAGGIIRKLVYEQSRLSRSHHVPFLSRPRGENFTALLLRYPVDPGCTGRNPSSAELDSRRRLQTKRRTTKCRDRQDRRTPRELRAAIIQTASYTATSGGCVEYDESNRTSRRRQMACDRTSRSRRLGQVR